MTTIGVVAIPTAAQANISSECVCIHGVAMQSDDWAVLIGFFTSVKDSATQKNQTTVGAWANKLIGHCARSYNGRFLRHRPKRSERSLNYERLYQSLRPLPKCEGVPGGPLRKNHVVRPKRWLSSSSIYPAILSHRSKTRSAIKMH